MRISGEFKISKWPNSIDIVKASILFLAFFIFEVISIKFDVSDSQIFAWTMLASFGISPILYGMVYIPRRVVLEIENGCAYISLGRKKVILNPMNFVLQNTGHTDTPWGTMDWSIRFSNNGKKYILMKSVPKKEKYQLSNEYTEYMEFHQKISELEKIFKNKKENHAN
ncbi:hypothetical protein EQG49_04310 [Periweissella cryptocerci]|uniref:Uncharacterized protein n=1 Tax=Periweissella cryptocerci TaxID=2506420 RepID=A0A4P6YSP2_9LACO|nr:hypothetical protein [Periweissella cryptocerci]QBO35738.1 hypothetical protein EQG49_04310 [Periweissella cryptocerci]